VFGIPSERHYIRLEFASVFLVRARAREAKLAPDNPLSAGEIKKLRRVSPNFSERDGMEPQPFEFRRCVRALPKVFELSFG
jgi:hypothetical protein